MEHEKVPDASVRWQPLAPATPAVRPLDSTSRMRETAGRKVRGATGLTAIAVVAGATLLTAALVPLTAGSLASAQTTSGNTTSSTVTNTNTGGSAVATVQAPTATHQAPVSGSGGS